MKDEPKKREKKRKEKNPKEPKTKKLDDKAPMILILPPANSLARTSSRRARQIQEEQETDRQGVEEAERVGEAEEEEAQEKGEEP
jgi:hypothetical protein